jgi:outer membrane lipoprotein-sorting protein
VNQKTTFSPVLILTVLIVLAPCLVPAGEMDSAEEKTSRILSSVARAGAEIKTISCDFIQERQTSMLKDPIVATGRFYFQKPRRMRWEFLRPSRSGFSIDRDRTRRWKEDPDRWQRFDLGQEPAIKALADQIFAWAEGDLPWIENRYEIAIRSEKPLVLRLTPRASEEKKFIRHLSISFSPDLAHVDSVEIRDKEGDSVRIRFVNVALNTPLPENLF